MKVTNSPSRAPSTTDDASLLHRMADAYVASDGEFVTFMVAGDRPDDTYAERLIHVLQHDVPALAACCDQRLANAAGVLLHANTMVRSGLWEIRHAVVQPFETLMDATGLPHIGAAVLRRTRFLEHFFRTAKHTSQRVPDRMAGWLVLLYAQALGPVRRVPQALLTRTVVDATDVLPAGPMGGGARQDDLALAAVFLLEVYCSGRAAFAPRYSEEWHAQFIAWLLHNQPPHVLTTLRGIAIRYDDASSVELMDAIAELVQSAAPTTER